MEINSIQTVIKTLESNPLIPLIASGGITVWLISNIKSIFNTIKNFVISLISFNIFNTYEDTRGDGKYLKKRQRLFNAIITDSKTLWERTLNLDACADFSGYGEDGIYQAYNSSVSERTITYGFSIKIMFGKLVLCHRGYQQNTQKNLVNTSLNVFFASKKKFMKKLDDEMTNRLKREIELLSNRNNVKVYYGVKNGGSCSNKNKRFLDSIFTNNDEHMELFNDIKKFISNKGIYEKMNYPYKYSALLEGVPGSGKSSTILAIASELNRDVEYINLATSSVDTLMDKINADTNGKIFVFEDIDALNASSNTNREDEKEGNTTNQMCVVNNNSGIKMFTISLSDLLNITDGLLSSDGAICLFTTNHIEKLDPALLRAGRMNKTIKFEYMNHDTANRMIKNYLGFEIENLKDGIKPAELQEDILDILLGRKTKEVLEKYRNV